MASLNSMIGGLRGPSLTASLGVIVCFAAGCVDQRPSMSGKNMSPDSTSSFVIDAGIVPFGSQVTQYWAIPEILAKTIRPSTKFRSSCECVEASVRSYSDNEREMLVLELQIDGGEQSIAAISDVIVDIMAAKEVSAVANLHGVGPIVVVDCQSTTCDPTCLVNRAACGAPCGHCTCNLGGGVAQCY